MRGSPSLHLNVLEAFLMIKNVKWSCLRKKLGMALEALIIFSPLNGKRRLIGPKNQSCLKLILVEVKENEKLRTS